MGRDDDAFVHSQAGCGGLPSMGRGLAQERGLGAEDAPEGI